MSEVQEQQVPEVTAEQSQRAMRQTAEMQAEALYEIVGLQLDRLMGIMVSGNKVSFQRKVQAAKRVKQGIQAALKYGVKKDLGLPEKGEALAQETNELAAVLTQAMENKMLLLADNYRQQQEDERSEELYKMQMDTQDLNNNETQGE